MPTYPLLRLETSVLNYPNSHGSLIAVVSNTSWLHIRRCDHLYHMGSLLPSRNVVCAMSYFLLVKRFVCFSL